MDKKVSFTKEKGIALFLLIAMLSISCSTPKFTDRSSKSEDIKRVSFLINEDSFDLLVETFSQYSTPLKIVGETEVWKKDKPMLMVTVDICYQQISLLNKVMAKLSLTSKE